MEKKVLEREINLVDMFWAICLKWRMMLVCAIVGAIFVGGIGYLKNVNHATESINENEKISLEEIELDEGSEKNVATYLKYKQMYEGQVEYNNNAPLMQLDANGFYRTTITYYIDNQYVVEYPLVDKTNNIGAMIEAYKASLRSEEFSQKLIETMEISEELVGYEKELVDFTNELGGSATFSSGGMQIVIYGGSKEKCDSLAKVVKDIIDSRKSVITEAFGTHNIILIEESCERAVDSNLMKFQQSNISRVWDYLSKTREMKNKLTADELSYVEIYESEQVETIDLQNGQVDYIQKDFINGKLVVIGFVGGGALVCFIFVLLYIFNTKLRLEDDFEQMYGIKLFGNVLSKNEQKQKLLKSIDIFVTKMRHMNKHYFAEEEAIAMIVAGIKISAKKLGTSKVYMTGAVMEKSEKILIDHLKKELEQTEMEIVLGRPILYDAEALEKSAEIGCVVLVEHSEISLYSDIAKEVEICRHQGIEILGAVVVS